MKIKLLKSISLILCFALISNIAVIPASAAIDEENILYDNNYCIFANDLMLNDYSARIDGSVYAGDNLQFTGNKNCIINGTLNCSNTDGENIAADNTVSDTESMADYTDQLNNEIFYKTIYDTYTFISGTEYDLNASMFVNGNLFLDQVTLRNKGYIKAADSIKFNAVNDDINDYSVFMYAENGDIYVQGTNLVINGILYAPNVKIELNAKKLTVIGMIIADKIEINGSELSVNKINSNDYPSFRPDIEIKISGEQKENRQVSFDISDSEDFDRIIKNRTEWSITAANGSSDNVFIDSDSSSESAKNAVLKQPGDYIARVTVFTDKKSYTYEQKFSIAEDISPIANIFSEDVFYRTTDNNEAVITAADISYSSDFDDIGSRIWSITFDSDNDGDFDDEEEIIVSMMDRQETKIKKCNDKIGDLKDKNTNLTDKITENNKKISKHTTKIESLQKIDKFLTNMQSREGCRENFIQAISDFRKSSLERNSDKSLKLDIKIAQKEAALTKATSSVEKVQLRNQIAKLQDKLNTVNEKISKLTVMTNKLEKLTTLSEPQADKVIVSATENIQASLEQNRNMSTNAVVDTVLDETDKTLDEIDSIIDQDIEKTDTQEKEYPEQTKNQNSNVKQNENHADHQTEKTLDVAALCAAIPNAFAENHDMQTRLLHTTAVFSALAEKFNFDDVKSAVAIGIMDRLADSTISDPAKDWASKLPLTDTLKPFADPKGTLPLDLKSGYLDVFAKKVGAWEQSREEKSSAVSSRKEIIGNKPKENEQHQQQQQNDKSTPKKTDQSL